MPPKAAPQTDVGPRRSTRAKTKPSAVSLAEEVEAPVERQQQRAKAKPESSGVGTHDAGTLRKGQKRKHAAQQAPDQDTSAPAASQQRKASKGAKSQQQHSSQPIDADASGNQSAGHSRPATDIAAAKPATQQPNTSAASCEQPGPSGSSQPAASDSACPKAHCTSVAGNADVMLNQTNIGANNNKFYRMQLLQEGLHDHWLWTRWGRVGDKGQTQLQGPFDADTGLKEFKKKFRCALHVDSHTHMQS